jgi:hypothetical protein
VAQKLDLVRVPLHTTTVNGVEVSTSLVVPTPEHDKLAAVGAASQAIGEFLDYAPYTLCECDAHGNYWPVSKSIGAILAEYFGIDRDQLEREKRALLDALRTAYHQEETVS